MVYLVVEYIVTVTTSATKLKSIHGTKGEAIAAKGLGDTVLECKLGTEEKDWEKVE